MRTRRLRRFRRTQALARSLALRCKILRKLFGAFDQHVAEVESILVVHVAEPAPEQVHATQTVDRHAPECADTLLDPPEPEVQVQVDSSVMAGPDLADVSTQADLEPHATWSRRLNAARQEVHVAASEFGLLAVLRAPLLQRRWLTDIVSLQRKLCALRTFLVCGLLKYEGRCLSF